MEYPVEAILDVSLDPSQIPAILAKYAFPFPPNPSRREELFREFIAKLPDTDSQIRIVKSLTAIAENGRATLANLKWWDVPNRFLFGDMTRDGYLFRVGFNWKATLKGEQPMPNTCSCQWVPDKPAPGGYFLLIEAFSYQEIKAQFASWLAKPLTLHPAFRP